MAKRPAAEDQAQRFRRTRLDHARETAEDYVEAIAALADRGGEARVGELAKLMGVSHVTVSRIVGRIAREGLVEVTPYRPVRLTAAGRKLAARSRDRHDVVLRFLLAIGVGPAQAEIDAEGIEHHVSNQTIAAMRRVVEGSSPLRTGSGASAEPARPARRRTRQGS